MDNSRIKVSHKQGVCVVELLDENILKVEEAIINEISKSLLLVAEENAPVQMLLSFTRVKYLSSHMLATLIRLNKRIIEGKGTLKLCGMKPAIYEMFIITKLNQILDIYDDEQSALQSFGG